MEYSLQSRYAFPPEATRRFRRAVNKVFRWCYGDRNAPRASQHARNVQARRRVALLQQRFAGRRRSFRDQGKPPA